MQFDGGDFEFSSSASSAATTVPQSSVPQLIEPLVARLQHDAFDPVAWVELLQRVRRGTIDQARVHYERFLKLYPTAAHIWQQYAEHEVQVCVRARICGGGRRCSWASDGPCSTLVAVSAFTPPPVSRVPRILPRH